MARAPVALRSRAFRSDMVAWAVFVVALLAVVAATKVWLHRRVHADDRTGVSQLRDFRLAVLAYDRIGSGESDRHVASQRLSEHFEALRAAGFHPVSLRQVRDAFRDGAPLPDGALLLTFDGGHRSTFETVDPLLRRMGWPAVMFLDPRLPEERHATYVYWDRLRRMIDSGIWDVGILGRSPEPARLVARRLGGYEVLASVSSAAVEGSSAVAGDERVPLAFENSLFGVNDPSADPRRLFRLRVPRDWSGRDLVRQVTFSLSAEAAACSDAAPLPAERWVLATGHLEPGADAMTLRGAPRGEAWIAGAEWARDFVFEVEVKPARGVFWVVQQEVGSRVQWRWGGNERTLYLQRLRPGEPVEVVSRVDLSTDRAAWHSLRVVKRGDGVWVEWDGAPVPEMPRVVSAPSRGHVGLATGTPNEAGEVAFRNARFAAIPYRVRGVSASPRQPEVQALLRDAPCLAAISPPGLVQRGSELAPSATNRQLLAMIAAHGAWQIVPAVEVSRDLIAEDTDTGRASEIAELAAREGWAGVRLVPRRQAAPSPGAEGWATAIERWNQTFVRRGLRLVIEDEPSGGGTR